MDTAVALYDVVTLTSDVASHGLVRGQVGTVVLVHQPDMYEVEFCDNDGHMYALLPLRADQLMVLHHEPVAV